MAGVLSPIQKTLAMVSRLEESVCGKTDDSTLASIYHRILPTTIRWLERISDTKPKYRDLTRLGTDCASCMRCDVVHVARTHTCVCVCVDVDG